MELGCNTQPVSSSNTRRDEKDASFRETNAVGEKRLPASKHHRQAPGQGELLVPSVRARTGSAQAELRPGSGLLRRRACSQSASADGSGVLRERARVRARVRLGDGTSIGRGVFLARSLSPGLGVS